MKLKTEENLLVVSGKSRDLNEVLDTLAAKDSKKVAAFLVEKASLPRELRIGALRLVLNDYVKIAKELVLSDEFMYRLNWYEKFSEYQLVNFWNILETSNADKFDAEKEAVRFKRTFYLLLLMNADAVEFTDGELEELLNLSTPESTVESFKEFMSESDGAFYDYECNFDGMSYEDFKTVLKKCSTVADIRNIATKYGINVPKRLKKDELVALVLEGLRRQGKVTDETEAELKKMSAITLQRYAKVNGVKASTEMKKDDIIEYIMNRIESSPKAVRKPRIQLATLPELEEFEFSKDYLREVNVVIDEDDDQEEVAPVVEPVVETPAVEPVVEEPVVEEPVVEEPVVEPVVEEVVEEPVVEEPVVEEVQEEEPVVEEVDAETEIVETAIGDEFLESIEKLLNSKDEQLRIEEERYNKMVEMYEKRLNYLEEMLISINSRPAPQAAPVTVNVNYPGEPGRVVEIVPGVEPVVQETPAETPVETPTVTPDSAEVAPVVVDSTFDTLTPAETAVVVSETMDGLTLNNGEVTPVQPAETPEQKRLSKKQRKEEKRLAKKQRKEEKRLAREQRKEEKRLAREQRKEEERLLKELMKKEKDLAREEKKLAKEEKRLAKKQRKEEAAEIRAERKRIKEERILNEEKLKAEKLLAADRRREEKRLAKQRRKQAKADKKAAKKQKKIDKKLAKERKVLEGQMAKATNEAYRYQKKKEKIERIRAKNDLAIYRKAKRRAFWGFIKAIIIIAILIVLAAFTITTLIDLGIIVGDFAVVVDNFATQYIPFMGPHGVARITVTSWVKTVIDFFTGLFGGAQAQ